MLDEAFVASFVERFLEAWNAHDPERVAALCTNDVTWYDPALPAPVRGRAAVIEFLRETWTCFPDLVIETPSPPLIDLDRRRAAQPWRASGTMLGPAPPFAATFKRVSTDGVDFYEFRDGLLSGYRSFYDLAEWGRQLGLIPPRGSRAERTAAFLQRLGARHLRKKAQRPGVGAR